MTLVDGRALVGRARAGAYAVAAFNVSNLETTQAIVSAAEGARAPVILQLSPGALAYAGYRPLTRLVMSAAEEARVDVTVHLDHCRDLDVVERALGDGFGSVMFDGSALSDEENAATTARVVGLARAASAAGSGEWPAVEGELGRIGGSEDTTLDEARAERSSPRRCRWFVEVTGIDILAPAIGSVHRMPDDSVELDLEHLAAVAAAAGTPLALHGGSGVARDQLAGAIRAGVAKVNISSRVGGALAAGIQAHWASNPADRDLRRYLGRGRDAVAALASEYFELTGSVGRSAFTAPAEAAAAIPGAGPVFEPE